MRAYSEDLRKKIVAAIEQRGMSKAEAARTFDVSLSSVSSDTLGVSDRESPSPPRRALDEPA
jgi:transposase-like protein